MLIREDFPQKQSAGRRSRADAQRNLTMLLQAAKDVFAEGGIDAPVRDIADRAGVGIGTLYRHFPKRSDLIAAVFAHEIEACADAADQIAAAHPPLEALILWMHEFVKLAATKRGFAQALHTGDAAYDLVAARREQRLFPAFRMLFDRATAAGEIRTDMAAVDFLNAAATMCMPLDNRVDQVPGRVMLLVDGLRFRNGYQDGR